MREIVSRNRGVDLYETIFEYTAIVPIGGAHVRLFGIASDPVIFFGIEFEKPALPSQC